MRYFLASDGPNVVNKFVFSGDDLKADAVMTNFLVNHPNLTIQELDKPTFDSTDFPAQQTPAQKAWVTLKATNPTPAQAVAFIVKFLGLE